MLSELTIKFEDIRARVDAASFMQDAGKNEDCKRILLELADDILKLNPNSKSNEGPYARETN